MAILTQTVRTVRDNKLLSTDSVEFDSNETLQAVRANIIEQAEAELGGFGAETDGEITVITRPATVTILKFEFED